MPRCNQRTSDDDRRRIVECFNVGGDFLALAATLRFNRCTAPIIFKDLHNKCFQLLSVSVILFKFVPSLLKAFIDRALLKCFEDCGKVLALFGILLEYWLKANE